jgi:ADP-ribose pyrophosphatase
MEILDKIVRWKGKFMSAVEIHYRDAKGVVRTWEAMERVNVGGIVVMVAITPANTVLIEKQFRPPLGRDVLELPAGLVDPGESMEDAARRELIEGPLSTGASTEILRTYLCTGLEHVGKSGGDDNEIIEVIEVPLDGVGEYLSRAQAAGTLVDLKVFGLVELARRTLSGS